VSNRRVGNELLEINLQQDKEGGIEEGGYTEDSNSSGIVRKSRAIGKAKEAKKTIGSELKDKSGEDHRAKGRSFCMSLRQPQMEGERRQFN